MPNDEVWTETIRQVRTNDSFYYEVGPDPDGLGLELRYIEIDPTTKTAKVHSRVGFSEQLALVISEEIRRAAHDYEVSEAEAESRRRNKSCG